MTLDEIQSLWNTAVRTGKQEDIEDYVEGVELLTQTLDALQKLQLIHWGEEWWSCGLHEALVLLLMIGGRNKYIQSIKLKD